MSVHVVVINWKACEETLACLESVQRSRDVEFVLHVIDNGSQDGSVDRIRERFPDARLQAFAQNLGFAAAANAGIRVALQEGCEFVLLMNNDARVEEDTLAELVAAARRRPECGLYGGKIFRDRAGKVLWCCGVELGLYPNLSRLRGHGRIDSGAFDTEEIVDSLTGCGLLVQREVFEKAGLFDEAFWVYVEDADLCLRAADHGFSCLYVPTAIMEHPGGGSTGGGYSPGRKYLTAYGSAKLVRKHGHARPRLLLAFWVCDVLLFPLLLLKGLVTRTLPPVLAKARGMRDGWTGRPPDRTVVEG